MKKEEILEICLAKLMGSGSVVCELFIPAHSAVVDMADLERDPQKEAI